MTSPTHRWKEFVTFADGRKPHWTFDGRPCWLATGVEDKNGVEIYEGDRVKFSGDAQTYTAVFENGAFWLNNQLIADIKRTHELEVVGHIAEEQQ